MRTTITIDDGLFKDLKAVASASGRTMSEIVDTALRESLARRRQTPRKRIVLPVDKGGSLRPGVDLDNSAALLDLMEGRGAPS